MVAVYAGVGTWHMLLNPRYVDKLQLKQKRRARKEKRKARAHQKAQEMLEDKEAAGEVDGAGGETVIDDMLM